MKRSILVLVSAVLLNAGVGVERSDAEVKFKWGPYLRLRHEFLKNVTDFENDKLDNRNYFRIKSSLWGQADIDDDISFYARLTNENRAYTYLGVESTGKKHYHYDINEFVIDNLFVDLKNIGGYPVDMRIGRQDFLPNDYGEGFLIADGTPQDGSRTYYFNAIKGVLHPWDKSSLEFILIKNNRTDDTLPIINRFDGEQPLNYSDESAFILYHRFDPRQDLHMENYYIYKHEDAGRPRPLTGKGKINTVGSFVKYELDPVTLRGQFAYQTGEYDGNDRNAFGGYAFIDREFGDVSLSPKTSFGYYYLSGDDQSTGDYEGFNQLFSTYPWVSELYNISYTAETGTGYWTNLQMWRSSLSLKFGEKTSGTLFYNYLIANEPRPGVHSSFGDGKSRGHLPMARIDHKFNKNVTAYFLAEYFIPGDFYAGNADPALFMRTEIQFKF